LDGLQVKVQVSHPETIEHEGAGYLSPAQLLHELQADALLRLEHTHRSGRIRKVARERQDWPVSLTRLCFFI